MPIPPEGLGGTSDLDGLAVRRSLVTSRVDVVLSDGLGLFLGGLGTSDLMVLATGGRPPLETSQVLQCITHDYPFESSTISQRRFTSNTPEARQVKDQ